MPTLDESESLRQHLAKYAVVNRPKEYEANDASRRADVPNGSHRASGVGSTNVGGSYNRGPHA